jgi:hypothetical protein
MDMLCMSKRYYWIAGFTVMCIVAALLWTPMPQPLSYHDFADHRAMFGVANFLDVASNAGFLIAGIAGLVVVLSVGKFEFGVERWPYAIFFLGVLFTAIGSSYYHLAPDNERLFWDRLPMTIAFMSLIAAQVVDRISVKAGLVLLLPMLAVGAASVFYWLATEHEGAGNVMPYGILQAYSVIMLLILAVLEPSRYTRGSDILWVFAWYVLAKVLEFFDAQVLALGHLAGGHALKHLAAAAAGIVVCRMLMKRQLRKATPKAI